MLTSVTLVPHEELKPSELKKCTEYIQDRIGELVFEVGDFIPVALDVSDIYTYASTRRLVLYVRRMEPQKTYIGKATETTEINIENMFHAGGRAIPDFRQLKPSLSTQIPEWNPPKEPGWLTRQWNRIKALLDNN